MKNGVKGLALVTLVAATFGMLGLWYKTYIVGTYYASSGIFLAIMGAVAPAVVIWVAWFAAREIVKFKFEDDTKEGSKGPRSERWVIVLLAALAFTACARANANVQTLITNDCGVTWSLIPPGGVIPARITPCQFRITVPDYPMQGETKFKTSFKDRVLAGVEISYEYSIVDAKVFIGEAKYLGKANTEVDDPRNASGPYESAENVVIDKRLRDVVTSLLINEDIVEFSQAEFEDKLLEEANKRLKDKGVQLNFLSFVPTPEEQTRLAIDMMTAMKVYEAKGLRDLGQKVAVARASATKIQVGRDREIGKDTDKD